MKQEYAVGIDLGTTYSCISYLNEHGSPITLPNQEGELSTPSIVLFDGDEVVVGTEALRNSIVAPERVIAHAKRHIGDTNKRWPIDGKFYTPIDIESIILKKLLDAAKDQLGPVHRAVITVPAQFSDIQRQNTIEAGLQAGLDHVAIINEPVAAALCYVLGTEGLWFTELADEQRIMVYDLGGGTFDLSLVKYKQDQVTVIASGGDLKLGGIDWNKALELATCESFAREFNTDPRLSLESMQQLSLEVEQTKRSLSVRPKAALTCQHGGHRKSYQISQEQFERLTKPLVDQTEDITVDMLKSNKMGWAHVDAVLMVGGSSRMPMIRNMLKRLSGRTLNTSLSPDQSIAHGAAYYAGMLLSNTDFARSILSSEATARLSKMKQQSVNARDLGFLVRDPESNQRFPHYLLPANTPLPAEVSQTYGTVIPNQKRVHLHVVESGTNAEQPYEQLGACVVDDLPPNLPEGTEIKVTLSYSEEARVFVKAVVVETGDEAHTEIVRKENLAPQSAEKVGATPTEMDPSKILDMAPLADEIDGTVQLETSPSGPPAKPKATVAPQQSMPQAKVKKNPKPRRAEIHEPDRPVPLCENCGSVLDRSMKCARCEAKAAAKSKKKAQHPKPQPGTAKAETRRKKQQAALAKKKARQPSTMSMPDDDDIIDLAKEDISKKPGKKQARPTKEPQELRGKKAVDHGEQEFWNLSES